MKDNPTHLYSVTAHDSNFQTGAPFRKGVYASGAGVLALVTLGGETVNVTVGAYQPVPVAVARVNATSTTATGIVGLN